MRRIIFILTVHALLLCSPAIAETIIRDLNPPARVIGCLGKPLGTRMTIAGARGKAMIPNPLGVSEIDGKPLKQPINIEIRGELQILKNVHYRLEGYEAGEFSGPPAWLSPGAQKPFQYRCFFVVTKVIEPKSE